MSDRDHQHMHIEDANPERLELDADGVIRVEPVGTNPDIPATLHRITINAGNEELTMTVLIVAAAYQEGPSEAPDVEDAHTPTLFTPPTTEIH